MDNPDLEFRPDEHDKRGRFLLVVTWIYADNFTKADINQWETDLFLKLRTYGVRKYDY